MGLSDFTHTQKSTGSLVNCESDTVCFDCEGIIHHKFLPCGQMVNKDYYLKVMKMLRGAVRRKRPDLWRVKNGCIITMLWHSPPF
jgi:hypothetical protein